MRAYRYQLPLSRPMELQGRSYATREGLLIETEQGWGEASPLPGFSRESLDDVVAAWRKGPPFHSPALQFAWDSAGSPLQPMRVPVSALLVGSSDDVVHQAERLADSACQCLKVKVGRTAHVADEVDAVRRIRQAMRVDQQLRLDANRAWELASAVEFGRGLAGCSIEYIEEPLRDPAQLELFYRETHIPYALDETIADGASIGDYPHAAAVVCKPTLLGGRARFHDLAAAGKPLVWSGCFESGVGIARIAQWAAEFSPSQPVGLDTYSWMAQDVLATRLATDDWRLELPHEWTLNHAMLVELR
jgi:O-succinylbenzoate synthase